MNLPTATLRVLVVDDLERPIAGAEVGAAIWDPENHGVEFESEANLFHADLPTSTYTRLSVSAPGHERASIVLPRGLSRQGRLERIVLKRRARLHLLGDMKSGVP